MQTDGAVRLGSEMDDVATGRCFGDQVVGGRPAVAGPVAHRDGRQMTFPPMVNPPGQSDTGITEAQAMVAVPALLL